MKGYKVVGTFICIVFLSRLVVEIGKAVYNVNKVVPKLYKFLENGTRNKKQEEITLNRAVPKRILLWNTPSFHTASLGHCSVRNCIVTKDRTFFNYSDVVVFYPRDLTFSEIPRKINNQIYVYINLESPEYTYVNFSQWKNAFNWTITYRRDSDNLLLYGQVTKREQRMKLNFTEIIDRKSKMAAWFNSHCNTSSAREVYANLLAKSFPVDVYGLCGPLKCNKTNDHLCWSMISTTYRYHLAFENSICRDYITEKSLKRINETIVLVVRGGADYGIFLPPDSYLNTKDFKSPSELSKFAKMLVKNKTEYLRYHRWRNFYRSQKINFSYCEICKRLNNISKYKRVYEDLNKWWTGEGYSPFCSQ